MARDTQDANARARLIEEAQRFYDRGWMPGTAGNLSLRTGDSPLRLMITASGVDKGALESDDIVEIDGSWHERLWAGRRPSAETWIHTAIYDVAPWTGAVFHLHTVPTTLMSMAAPGPFDEVSHLEASGLEMLKGLGLWNAGAVARIPVFPNWPDVQQIGDDIRGHLESDAPPVLLIRGHGLTAWGRTAREARKHIECADFICSCLLELHRTPGLLGALDSAGTSRSYD